MNQGSNVVNGLILTGVAVDPLHAGAGRSPGLVDLPVQRDSLGYPLVYASSIKGALKSLCFRRLCSSLKNALDDKGFIKCNGDGCKLCCCLFGPEPGESEKGSSKLAVLDLVPVAFPAPSTTCGYLYVTTQPLLSRAYMILEALTSNGRISEGDDIKEVISTLDKLIKEVRDVKGVVASTRLAGNVIDIAGTTLKVDKRIDENVSKTIVKLVQGLGGITEELGDKLVVVPDELGKNMVERSLWRVTRVALHRDRKTVSGHMLWTEEYIPPMTIFLSGLVLLPFSNQYCEEIPEDELMNKLLKEVLKSSNYKFYAVIGGKETVGRGLIKFIVKPCRTSKEG